MRKATGIAIVLILLLSAMALPAAAQPAPNHGPLPEEDRLEQFEAEVSEGQLRELVRQNVDITARRRVGDRFALDLVLSNRERRRLADLGVETEVKRNEQGLSATEFAASQAEDGYQVWRPYSGPGGIAEQLHALHAAHPDITTLESIGQSVQGQDILAMRVTGPGDPNARPTVLYNALQHAREWIAGEVNLRLLRHYLDNYGSDPEVTGILDTTELWFVPVVNPDGYDYTFTEGNRLWRKNLRDNNGDGQITSGDGVDPNRNWPEKWGWDNEGSSPDPSSETYRGTGPASEPEVRALDRLMRRERPSFQLDYHSYGQLLLYPYGWQMQTRTADNPIYVALSGTDENPAVPGFDPDLSSELYLTNGVFDDHAHFQRGILAWTPELSEGCEGCGFVFPDDEQLIQEEFERNLAFALDLARSADDPANPESHLGNTTPDFVPDAFAISHGSPQTVQVNAKRGLGPVALRYRINGGRTRIGSTYEYDGGERHYRDDDIYYHRLRGTVRGAEPGDTVEVWFEAIRRRPVPGSQVGRVRSEPFTYTVASNTGNPVLVVAAEDYTGLLPPQEGVTEPQYAGYYVDALAAAGHAADVYDIDANGRTAPDQLGVLSHYDAVVIETGDDFIPRSEGQVPGTTAQWAGALEIEARDYLNDGGKLVYAGKYAGFTAAQNAYYYNPPEESLIEGECLDPGEPACVPLTDDFLQYWLGAYLYASDSGTNPDTGEPHDLVGAESPFVGAKYTFGGGDGADNQDHTASFLPTSSFLPPREFPQFASRAPLDWLREGPAPYDPRTGEFFVASQQGDMSYKRLTQTVDLTGAATGTLNFWVSADIEPAWDFLIVEAHTPGEDDWTTLEVPGLSTQDTGESCPAGWIEALHPFLAHYQTLNEDGTCSPSGTTGEWHGITGNTNGWQQATVDLSGFAGGPVEVSISYVSDWAFQGIGVFLDDVSIVVDGATVAETSFEEDLGGWELTGPPEGSGPNPNDWTRSGTLFEEGAAVTTDDTVYFGFGVEGLSTAEERADLMRRALDHLFSD